jgi:hypothetical protein
MMPNKKYGLMSRGPEIKPLRVRRKVPVVLQIAPQGRNAVLIWHRITEQTGG